MDKKRIGRISSELQKEISSLIRNDLNDPRIATFTSVTEVDLTDDLQSAKIYISVLGNDEEKHTTIEGLKSSIGFIKRELGRKMKLRHIPELKIILDNKVEEALYMENLIDKVIKQDNEAINGRIEE